MKSKRILAAALACALVISAASGASSVFAATYDDAEAAKTALTAEGFTVSGNTVTKGVTVKLVDEVTGKTYDDAEGTLTATYDFDSFSADYDFDVLEFNLEFAAPGVDETIEQDEKTYRFNGWNVEGSSFTLADLPTEVIATADWEEITSTDPADDDDNDDNETDENQQIDAYTVDVSYYTGYNHVDYTTVDVPANAKEFKVTAPGNLKDDLNEVASWNYAINILDADGTWVKDETGSVAPGKDLVITLEEGQKVDEYITFNAVWKDPDGKINVTEYIEGGISFFATAAKGDKFNGIEAVETMKNSGDYYLWLGGESATIDVVVDLSTGEKTYPKNPTFKVPDVKAPEKKGYKFVGWSTSPNGKVEYKTGDAIAIKTAKDEDGDSYYYLSICDKATSNGYSYYQYAYFYAVYEKEGNPGTGDGFTAVPFIASAVVSLGAVAGVMVYKKRRDLTEEAE